MTTRRTTSRKNRKRSAVGRILLLVCFVWASMGMSLPQKAVDHPNCPCGCQGEATCRSGAPPSQAKKAGCCSQAGSCCGVSKPKPTANKPACCQQKEQETKSASWDALCRCGEKIGHYVVLATKFQSANSSVPETTCLQSGPLLLISAHYESRSEAPCPPPPRIRLLPVANS
ncbi:hypothetical protein [Rubinisphaera sp. JC750]|uniref:hypothetical protein n=1 Tax=Rubinisphaera sp. JC750 TaxID=2898658 RepID=UPI001F238274|nr:hypothetical protein [Rubinisphaera sp. JC750]